MNGVCLKNLCFSVVCGSLLLCSLGHAQDANVDQSPYIENGVNVCLGLLNERFEECFGPSPEGDTTEENETFCRSEERMQAIVDDLTNNRTCIDAVQATNSCALSVPCDQLNDAVFLPLSFDPFFRAQVGLDRPSNIPANNNCEEQMRFSGEACFGFWFNPIFDDQGDLIEYEAVLP